MDDENLQILAGTILAPENDLVHIGCLHTSEFSNASPYYQTATRSANPQDVSKQSSGFRASIKLVQSTL